jgi:hypothetical protein
MIVEVNGQTMTSNEVTVRSQTYTGFFALDSLEPFLLHMDCYSKSDLSKCGECPVLTPDDRCVVLEIREGARKEAAEKKSGGGGHNGAEAV